jgi:Arc/MetJ family transcription regulator
MATYVSIDSQLLAEAHEVGGLRTKKATVAEALHEYIQHRKQRKTLELFDTIELDLKYDYKKQRRKS